MPASNPRHSRHERYRRYKAVPVCIVLAIGLGLGLLLWRDLGRMQRQAAQIDIERVQLSALQRDMAKARRQRQSQQKNGPMTDDGIPAIEVLHRIGAAWAADISLLRLVSDMPKQRLRLQILARSNDALFNFVARLKQQAGTRAFVEMQADRPAESAGEWALDASVVVAW